MPRAINASGDAVTHDVRAGGSGFSHSHDCMGQRGSSQDNCALRIIHRAVCLCPKLAAAACIQFSARTPLGYERTSIFVQLEGYPLVDNSPTWTLYNVSYRIYGLLRSFVF